ncbi:MAG: WXG100 family type VII secretion target [Micromonosporaceae bacterium]|nr:WXG100 family type VII secretion target [Micromonosporaceae bacterium]
MADFSVNPNGMLDVGDELQQVTRRLNSSLEELDKYVENFKQVNQGDAAIAFTAAQQKWHEGMAQMQSALAVAQQRLNDIHENYLLGDKRGASLFGGTV